jgi:hypothetical protein
MACICGGPRLVPNRLIELDHCVKRMNNALNSLGGDGCARDEGARASQCVTELIQDCPKIHREGCPDG